MPTARMSEPSTLHSYIARTAAFLLPLAACCAFWPGRLGDAFEPIKLGLVGMALALIWGFGCRLTRNHGAALLLALAWLLLAGALGASSLDYLLMGSVERFQGVLALLLCGLLGASMAVAPPALKRLICLGMVAALWIQCLVVSAQFLGHDPLRSQAPRPPALVGNAVIASQLLALLLPFLWLDRTLSPRLRNATLMAGSLSLLMLGTRSALLAVALWMLLIALKARGISNKRLLLLAVIMLLVLGAAFSTWRSASVHERLLLWQAALHALADFQPRQWLFGVGADMRFTVLEPAWIDLGGSAAMHADRAHQLVLDAVLSYGVAGLLVGGSLAWLVIVRMGWCASTVALGSWLTSLQFGFALSADSVIAAIVLGLGWGQVRAARGADDLNANLQPANHSLRNALSGLALATASIWTWLWPDPTHHPLRKPEQALRQFEMAQRTLRGGERLSLVEQQQVLSKAEQQLAQALRLDPLRSDYSIALKAVRTALAQRSSAAARQGNLCANAERFSGTWMCRQ